MQRERWRTWRLRIGGIPRPIGALAPIIAERRKSWRRLALARCRAARIDDRACRRTLAVAGRAGRRIAALLVLLARSCHAAAATGGGTRGGNADVTRVGRNRDCACVGGGVVRL